MSDRLIFSLRAYAKHRGCRLSAVQKAISSGRIHKTDEGKIDVEQADKDWAANTNIAKAHPEKSANKNPQGAAESKPAGKSAVQKASAKTRAHDKSATEFLEARAKRERSEAGLKELTLRERTGELLSALEVARAEEEMILTVRNRALMLPAELAPKLAVETDQTVCQDILHMAIYGLLSELSVYKPGRKRAA